MYYNVFSTIWQYVFKVTCWVEGKPFYNYPKRIGGQGIKRCIGVILYGHQKHVLLNIKVNIEYMVIVEKKIKLLPLLYYYTQLYSQYLLSSSSLASVILWI